MNKQITSTPSSFRPPIVAVLGHVDHGKTSLLDFIRKTNVASREHGGITQHIGAYQIKVKGQSASWRIKGKSEEKEEEHAITFIDTPGHEAFAKMRSRGASVADIAILVVAADDSVKPQTVESIGQIKEAKIPLIVAVNKMDLPAANIDKVKQDLAKHGVQVEQFGGDVPIVPVSAKTGAGVPELLDMILLVAQMHELGGDPSAPLAAFVIETRVDKGKGMVATVIPKVGTIRRGTELFSGNEGIGKVRAMFDEYGQGVGEGYPSKPVEVIGFTKLPSVGVIITDIPTAVVVPVAVSAKPIGDNLPDFLKPLGEIKQSLLIVLKADTAGSLEAIEASLDPQVTVVSRGIGDITDADILLAKSSRAFVVGFQVKIGASVTKLAETEKVVFRTYTIIYELLDELSEVVAGMSEVLTKERELGVGQIIAEFPFDGARIAGTKVTSGRLARGDMVKILRGETEVGRAKIKSLRRGKQDVTKAETGTECGVLFDKKLDFTQNDGIIAFT